MKSNRIHIVLLIILFLVLGVLYWYSFSEIKEINVWASQEMGNKKMQEARLQKDRDFKTLLLETERVRKDISSSFVPHDDVAAFLSALEALAQKWGVKLTVTTVTETPAVWDPTVMLLNLHVDVSGPFERLLTFESVLQNMPVYAIISNSTFTFDGKALGASSWRAGIDLSIIERNHVSTP